MILSSPNRVVWEYFRSVRLLAERAGTSESQELCRQTTALTVIMAVTVVEVFFNLWFRVRVEEMGTAAERVALLRDLRKRISLDKKFNDWPRRYLSVALNTNDGTGAEFVKLRTLRNSIVHFSSSHEQVNFDGGSIHGLANTSEYDALASQQAAWALETAENVVAEIFRLASVPEKDISGSMRVWTGK